MYFVLWLKILEMKTESLGSISDFIWKDINKYISFKWTNDNRPRNNSLQVYLSEPVSLLGYSRGMNNSKVATSIKTPSNMGSGS